MKELPELNEEMFQLDSAWTTKAPRLVKAVPNEPTREAGLVLRQFNNVSSPDLGNPSGGDGKEEGTVEKAEEKSTKAEEESTKVEESSKAEASSKAEEN